MYANKLYYINGQPKNKKTSPSNNLYCNQPKTMTSRTAELFIFIFESDDGN